MRYFPLFADLSGRRVLVVGGGAVAERKIRLLLDAGAQVTVVAPELTDWLTTPAAADAAPRDPAATPGSSEASVAGTGTLVHVAAHFEPAHFDGALFAVAATDDRAVNALVAATGRERNVLVNVVDDVELSSFIVPAIVDRSPLVIAISTGGVAPVLARLVRERLEALLDNSFGSLAGLLERWRGRIKSAVPNVAARRRFYENVVRGSVAGLVRSTCRRSRRARTRAHPGRRERTAARLSGAGRRGARRCRPADSERTARTTASRRHPA